MKIESVLGSELQIEKTGFLSVQSSSEPEGPLATSSQPILTQKSSSQHLRKKYTCSLCETVFPLKVLLYRHQQNSCKENLKLAYFTCSLCSHITMYKTNMDRHIRNVHNTGHLKFKCDLCNFRSNYNYCIRRHMKNFHRISSTDTSKK